MWRRYTWYTWEELMAPWKGWLAEGAGIRIAGHPLLRGAGAGKHSVPAPGERNDRFKRMAAEERTPHRGAEVPDDGHAIQKHHVQ